jgi:hypothetical protein
MLEQSICHVYIIHFQKSVTNFTEIMKMNLTDNLHSKIYATHELRQQKNNVTNYPYTLNSNEKAIYQNSYL